MIILDKPAHFALMSLCNTKVHLYRLANKLQQLKISTGGYSQVAES